MSPKGSTRTRVILGGRQVFVYRWGTNPRLWGSRPITPADALEELRDHSLARRSPPLETGDPKSKRAPNNTKRVVAGDVLLFYAGQQFRRVDKSGVYGIALAGTVRQEARRSLAVSLKDWRVSLRWLPSSPQLAMSPFQGRDREFAPSGPAATLLHLNRPSARVVEFVQDALKGTLVRSATDSDGSEDSARGGGRRGGGERPPPDLAVAVSAYRAATRYYKSANWQVTPVQSEGLGWDLEARRNAHLLRIEVKGLSSNTVAAELTPKEYAMMLRYRSTYRLCIVTDATARRPLIADFRWDRASQSWRDGSGRVLRQVERLGLAVRLGRILVIVDSMILLHTPIET